MDNRVRESSPKEKCCSSRGIGIGDVRDDHQRGECWKVFDQIEVGSLGALSPCGWSRRVGWIVQCCDEALALDAF